MNKKMKLGLVLINLLLGSLLLSACAAGGNPLDSTNWQLTTYRDGNGELVRVKADAVVTAQFQAGQVSGIAGCNNYSGSYQVDGKQLTFGPQATTRKMCAEPAGVMDQEDAYLAALSQVKTFKLSGNTLEMSADNGETILIFTSMNQ